MFSKKNFINHVYLQIVTFIFIIAGYALFIPLNTYAEHKISNSNDLSFTVSWKSNDPLIGEVHYGTTTALGSVAYDQRGSSAASKTHLVKVSGLTPSTLYYYDVVTGVTVDNNGGKHYKCTTGPTLQIPSSDTGYGEIMLPDGTTPADGALVYLTIVDHDNCGSPGISTLQSCIVESGYWNIQLNNARVMNLSAYFDYSDQNDLLHIVIESTDSSSKDMIIPMKNGYYPLARLATQTGEYTYYRDADNDKFGNPNISTQAILQPPGYVPDNTDCNDTDPNTNPRRREICDGKDNDCNGIIPTIEQDNDKDNVRVCAGDCNDNDNTTYPGAKEQCDGVDNDCNGSVPADEADADDDRFRICSGDCNDTSNQVHPGAAERADNKDNDCDGKIDESNIILIRQDSNLKQWLVIHTAPTATNPDIGPVIASYATPIGNAKATSTWAVFAVVAGDFDADGIHEIAVFLQNNTAPFGQYLNIYEAPQAVGVPLPAPIAGFKWIGAPNTFNNVSGAIAGDFIPGHPGDEIGLLKENTATGGQRIVFYAPPTTLNQTLPLESNAFATYKWIGNRNALMVISASSGDYNNDGATEIGFVYQNNNPISLWKGTQLLHSYTSPLAGYSAALPPGSLIASIGYLGIQNTASSILDDCGGNFVQTNAADEFMFMRKNALGKGSLRIIRPPQTLNAVLPAPLAADYDIGTDVIIISGIKDFGIKDITYNIEYLESLQQQLPDNYMQELKSIIENNNYDPSIRERGISTLAYIATRKNESDRIVDFLKELAINEKLDTIRISAYATIDLIRDYHPLERRGSLDLSVSGRIIKGSTITLIARVSSTINLEEEVMVGITSLHDNIELLSGNVIQKVYLKANEPCDIEFNLKLNEIGSYHIPVTFFMSLDRIDYEKIQKEVYIVVNDVCYDCIPTTDQIIVIDKSKPSGPIAGKRNSIIQSIADQASYISFCPPGCECLTVTDAEYKFGSGSIKACSDIVCGYGWVGDLKLPKYCYSELSLDECIDTDGGKNYNVKGSAPGCIDKCSEFSDPPVVVRECYTEVVDNKCVVNVDYHDCDSICEDGRCLPPTCNDWLQNQGEAGVDCGSPCAALCVCPSGCKCVTGTEAENKFGAGGYMSCSGNVCGYGWVGDLKLPKYCYKKIESYDCIDTDGGADIYEKGSAPGCEDTCSSLQMLQECLVNNEIDGCEAHSAPYACEGLCQDGRCMPPTCDDGIQNQDEVSVDCSINSIYADCDSCCNNGIKDYDEEGVDCGGSQCTPCGWVVVKGRILYEDSDSTTGLYKPVRYGKIYLRLCDHHPCNSPTHQALWMTDSVGNFNFMVPRNNFKSVFIRLGHADDDDVYMVNYAVQIAKDLDACDETVWWHSGSREIPPTGNIDFGELRIGMNSNIDFQGYWQEETDAITCGGGDDESGTINGGSGYFNIADAILYARQYADGRRSDNDAIGYVDVQWPDATDVSHYGSCWEEITLRQESAFSDYTIIHEYGHYLQDAIGTNDDYWGDSDHDFCTHGKDEEFAWKEGFAEYFGTIVPHNYSALSNPDIYYTRIESPYCFENNVENCCNWAGKESESTTAAVLWDLADNPATFTNSINENFDTIHDRETLIFNIFDDELDNGDSIAADAPDLCEFIEQGLNCRMSSAEKEAFWYIMEHYNVICSTACDD